MDTRLVDRNINKHIKNWKTEQSWTILSIRGTLEKELNELTSIGLIEDKLLLEKIYYLLEKSKTSKTVEEIIESIKFAFSSKFDEACRLDNKVCKELSINF
jgi:hypothetical protein